MSKNINEYKIFLDGSSEKINNLTNSEIIDPIISIEIINPCMIPNSNEIFEYITMKLLCTVYIQIKGRITALDLDIHATVLFNIKVVKNKNFNKIFIFKREKPICKLVFFGP